MADGSAASSIEFAPKQPVHLAPPKDDLIALEHLPKCDGTNAGFPTCVAIMGTVFDVSANQAYAPRQNYHVFAGKEPNRALGKSSLSADECQADFSDLSEKEKSVLKDWHTFFSKRYNIVGRTQPRIDSSL